LCHCMISLALRNLSFDNQEKKTRDNQVETSSSNNPQAGTQQAPPHQQHAIRIEVAARQLRVDVAATRSVRTCIEAVHNVCSKNKVYRPECILIARHGTNAGDIKLKFDKPHLYGSRSTTPTQGRSTEESSQSKRDERSGGCGYCVTARSFLLIRSQRKGLGGVRSGA
jgi:hypothetical protein